MSFKINKTALFLTIALFGGAGLVIIALIIIPAITIWCLIGLAVVALMVCVYCLLDFMLNNDLY